MAALIEQFRRLTAHGIGPLLMASVVLLGFAPLARAVDPEPDSPPLAAAALARPPLLDGSGAVIGKIWIQPHSIFDLEDPDEDGFLYRWANRLHVETREEVIRQQLLFESGDVFSSRELQESERILRANRYLHDASIHPVSVQDGVVDLAVETVDVWTLEPHISASRSGGENSAGIGFKEMNLLGTGIEIEALYKSDVDRDSKIFRFADNHLGDSWYRLAGVYAAASDGHEMGLEFGKPFYALDSTSTNGISLWDSDEIDRIYDRGEIGASYRHSKEHYELYGGWSKGLQDGWVRRFRAGLGYDQDLFSEIDYGDGFLVEAPQDRRLVYPFIEMELLQDRFEKTQNLDQISQTEDRFVGSRLTARLGYAAEAFGSDRDAWILGLNGETSIGDSNKQILLLSSGLSTRLEQGDPRNLVLDLSARYYRRQSEHRLLYASLSGSLGHELDADNYMQLGGDSGLRGYPLRYQGGDRYALLTLEQRYFTDWYPFRLFRIGGAVFMDIGKAWGSTNVNFHDEGTLRDIGFGLRIGKPRSGMSRMTHIDLAFPLDGGSDISNVQLVIETKKSF